MKVGHMSDKDHYSSEAFAYYPRLEKVRNYVEKNNYQGISLARVARVANLEPKYFSVYFRQKTGIGFRDWLADLRIHKAKEMMRSRNYAISEIAYAVGFCDLRTFERTFKCRVGMTPRAYRDSVRPLLSVTTLETDPRSTS